MRKAKPSWAVRVPQPERRQFDRKTERAIARSLTRKAEGRWDSKGDPKAKA